MENLILLKPFTYNRCHEFYQGYQADPQMWGDGTFTYNKEAIDRYYQHKVLDENRRFFAICLEDKVIGEIQLKRICLEKGEGTLSVHLQRDEFKNKGYGTQAEKMVIAYGFNRLKLQAIYADCVKNNLRSQHVLQKIGFMYTHEDENLKYYKMKTPL